MKRLIAVLVLLSVPIACCHATEPPAVQEFNTALMLSTVKIKSKKDDTNAGTAFIIFRKNSAAVNEGNAILITAAHVLESLEGKELILCLRKKNPAGLYEKYEFAIKVRSSYSPSFVRHRDFPLWTRHPDPEIDVACMNVNLPQGIETGGITADMLADNARMEELSVHPGSELLHLGFPMGMENNGAAFPILRAGRIASYPVVGPKDRKTILCDFRICEGHSGGPVYLSDGNSYFIVGLVSKERTLTVKKMIKSLFGFPTYKYSLDLADIVPAQYIIETIEALDEQKTH